MNTPPRRYRWLTEGETYHYRARTGLDGRRGALCVVVTLPRAGAKPANVLVKFGRGREGLINPLKLHMKN